ncbi:unnamed protein product [Symbiodinium pilosum]|uniref:Uncharacterized protein n=1 Tax=Symbiodinium pilosum TaxID=2952 RepID=A0A812WJQ7_SYMPI|nr:unnamed protein product [Symbiodinium pilosum]
MDASPPPLDRTPSAHSRHTTAAAWCFERQFDGQELRPPVRIVVFDCDETLTLSTFLPDDVALRTQLDWTSQWEDYIATVNFESPFTSPGRLSQLREMLEDLRRGTHKLPGRMLAVLTRNNNGPIACLNLLRAAKLAQFFDAIWCMSQLPGIPTGIYRAETEWLSFEPPLFSLPDHKAHVVHSVAEQPAAWFPQIANAKLHILPDSLRPEEILLVDDVRTNFQCGGSNPKKVYRCCKVARYDAPNFRDMGLVRDMGGLGAHNEEDYKTLADFAKRPWAYKVDWRVHCIEKPFEGAELQPPVKLIIFDFDSALTLYTFMPEDPRCSKELGYSAPDSLKARYVEYNFETPYLEGSRVEQLGTLLKLLAHDAETDERRVLAVLTVNEAGAIAVLNLLMMADLANHFSAIWTLSTRIGEPGGVYRHGSQWKTNILPQPCRKLAVTAEVLESLLAHPSGWFPQISEGSGEVMEEKLLSGLSLANIVLVDDARTPSPFLQDEEYDALRHCRVASYDDEYRDQGLLWHMGGIGARSSEDYGTLLSFVRSPWNHAGQLTQMTSRPSFGFGAMDTPREDNPIPLQRSKTEQDLAQRLPQACKKREAEAAGLSDEMADSVVRSSTTD